MIYPRTDAKGVTFELISLETVSLMQRKKEKGV
jgi:hypothetical protein